MAALTTTLLCGLAAPAAAAAAQEGRLFVLTEYAVPDCKPSPGLSTVFSWLSRTVLGIEEYFATSADCGLTSRSPKETNGWSYVFWSENDDSFVAERLKKKLRFGRILLEGKPMDEAYPIHSKGFGAFVLIQLAEADYPMYVWALGDVARLTASVSVADEGGLRLAVESVTHEGRLCKGSLALDGQQGPSRRQALGSCRAGS